MSVRKVLHVVPSLGGGHPTQCAALPQLASSLARLGVDTHVATTCPRRECGEEPSAPDAQDSVTYWRFPRHLSFSTASVPLWSWLSREIASFDIVHIHSLLSVATPPAAMLARRGGVPYIVQPLDGLDICGRRTLSLWERARFCVLRSRVLRHAAMVHFTSEDERLVAERLKVTVPSIVIPPALPTAPVAQPGVLRRRLGLAGSRRIALAPFPSGSREELAVLLRAVVQMRAMVSGAVLALFGEGTTDLIAQLKADMRALGLGDYEVFWAGPLTDAERRSALADAQAFVVLSCPDSRGTLIKEAMSAGLPVVVSENVGLHEEVEEADAGIVVPLEPAPLARAMGSVLAQPTMSAAMGTAGVDLIRRRYSTDAVARRLLGAYEQIRDGVAPVGVSVSLDAVGADC